MKEKLEVGGRGGQHQAQILNTKFKRRNSCCGPSHFKEKSIKEKKTIVIQNYMTFARLLVYVLIISNIMCQEINFLSH